ncbi:hypothetical protein FRC03_009644 [Tulasnella sp. 419]|nr:hypothetical protein FRC03_009644 [Tulasnella sp. 419]
MLRSGSQISQRISQALRLEAQLARQAHGAATKLGNADKKAGASFTMKQKGKPYADKPVAKGKEKKSTGDSGSQQSAPFTARTRYALKNRPDVTENHELPSRRPFGVIQQIKPLLKEGKLPDAIEMVKKSPLSSQNVVVWAILIQRALDENKRELAWSLWNDMKKRGFSPSIRTYAAFFSGFALLAKSSKEVLTVKQLQRLASVWEQYEEHIAELKSAGHNSHDPTVSYVSPYNTYFSILAATGQHERMLDLLSEMDKDGPFAPDFRVYTTVVAAISKREVVSNGNKLVKDPDVVQAENASVIKALWNDMEDATTRKNPKYRLQIDSFALASVLRGLMKGGSEDRVMALQLVQQYVNLDIPDGNLQLPKDSKPTKTPTAKGEIQPTRYLLEITMELLSTMGPTYLSSCLNFAQKIQSTPELRDIADRRAFEYALDACVHLASNEQAVSPIGTDMTPSQQALSILKWLVSESFKDPDSASTHPLYPQRDTYNRVLLAAWRCKDLEAAFETFEIMTGFTRQQFQFSIRTKAEEPGLERITSTKSKKNIVDPDAQSLGYLFRTARAVGKRGAEKTMYSIFEHYGGNHFFPSRYSSPSEKHRSTYYEYVLADTMQETLMEILSEPMTKNQREVLRSALEKLKGIKQNLKRHADTMERDVSLSRAKHLGTRTRHV